MHSNKKAMDKTMTDNIKKLYIEPTSACNLNCSMCFRHNWINEKKGFISEVTFESIIKSLQNVKSIDSVMFGGMGEPLLHKNIANMVSEFACLGIRTELVTNATMLSEKLADELIEAGLSCLWVSVDGFDSEAYEKIQRGSEFELIKKNIAYFNSKRKECKMGMTFVVMADNNDELNLINNFADSMGFDFLNMSYVVPSSPLTKDRCLYDAGFLIGKQSRVDFDGQHQRKYNYCPFIEEDNCFIKWNGDVTACMQLLHSSYSYLYEEKREVLAKSFGNINDAELIDIWNSKEYSDFRKRVKEFEFPDCTLCNGCDDRLSNKTDCMYNSFPTCGACLWAQGVGRCP